LIRWSIQEAKLISGGLRSIMPMGPHGHDNSGLRGGQLDIGLGGNDGQPQQHGRLL
jgi:hypothetical protein